MILKISFFVFMGESMVKKNPFVANNNDKIRLSFFVSGLALAMVLAFLGLFFVTANNSYADSEYWTDYSYRASKFGGGIGTSSNPYKIYNAEQLAYLAYGINNYNSYYKNKYFSLQNNISLVAPDKSGNQLVWEPIGTEKYPFSGTFLGNGYTVSGMFINQSKSEVNCVGLFGYINGSVDSLRVEGMISGSYSYVGGVIGYAFKDAKISKLSSNVNIVLTEGMCGGVVGFSAVKIEQCASFGTIYSSGDVGGIAGRAFEDINDCYNKGDITGSDNAGGIVGLTDILAGNSNGPTVTNSYNCGTVVAGYAGGGIVGNSSQELTIKNCYNIGLIRGSKHASGGILGSNDAGGDSLSISKCYNTGDIEGVNAGGIVGYTRTATSSLNIKDCYNNSNISGSHSAGGIAGGLSGKSPSSSGSWIIVSSLVSNCFNIGTKCTVSSSSHSGGIVGSAYRVAFENCTNYSSIVCTSSDCGGVVGYLSIESTAPSTTYLQKCHNMGKVSGKSYTGGIAGEIETGSVTSFNSVYYCINTGSVMGDKYTGGIVGSAEGTQIKICLNMGSVTSSSWISVGGIIGKIGYTSSDSVYGCINYGTVKSTFKYNDEKPDDIGVGGIIGHFPKKTGEIKYCLNAGQIIADSYTKSKYKYKYTGQIAGRNVSDNNKNSNCYAMKSFIASFGDNSNSGTDRSNGTPARITSAEFNTMSIPSKITWKRYGYNSLTYYEKDCEYKLEATLDTVLDGLILVTGGGNAVRIPNYKTNAPFDFQDLEYSNSVWAYGNPAINDGQPYFKDRYW